MNLIVFLLTIALLDNTVLSASLLPKEVIVKQGVVKEANDSTVKSDRQGRQFWSFPIKVFYPSYFSYPFFPSLPYQQILKNRPFYESKGKKCITPIEITIHS